MSRTTNNRRKKLNRRDLCGGISRRVKRWFQYYCRNHEMTVITLPAPYYQEATVWQRKYVEDGPVVIAPRAILKGPIE